MLVISISCWSILMYSLRLLHVTEYSVLFKWKCNLQEQKHLRRYTLQSFGYSVIHLLFSLHQTSSYCETIPLVPLVLDYFTLTVLPKKKKKVDRDISFQVEQSTPQTYLLNPAEELV